MFVGAAIALTFLGNFFWSFFKDFHRTQTNGGHGSNVPLLIFGGFFLVMIMAVLISVARGVRKLSKPDSAIPREEKPWLARPDWAAGKIKSSTASQIKMFAFMALIFCGIGAMYAFAALPKELRNGNYKSLIVLIFPAVGIGFLIAVVRALLARRRFGDCFFEPAQIPAPLGGALEGMILTGARLKLEQGLHLKISCIRRIVSGSGKNQSVQENILWQDEKIFKPEANLPDPEPGRSGIPVFFKLPANQPECYSRGNESVFWRLEAKSKMRGPDFCAVFDVPVFQMNPTRPPRFRNRLRKSAATSAPKSRSMTARTGANFISRRRETPARRRSPPCSCWFAAALPPSHFIFTRRSFSRFSSDWSAFC
jgi:hypothetical protein